MSNPDPTQIYLQEAQELLEQLETALLDLDHDLANGSLIDTAFRALHTIKGSGAMFGFDAVAAFTHHVEGAFDRMRNGTLAPTRNLVAVALAAKDHIRQLIASPGAADTAGGQAILEELERLTRGRPVEPEAGRPQQGWHVRFRLPRDAMAMGTNPLLLLEELRGLGSATVAARTGDVPPLAAIDPAACYLGWDVRLVTEQPRAAIEDVFIFVMDDMELSIEPLAAPQDARPQAPAAAAVPAGPAASSPQAQGQQPVAFQPANTVRVPTERLDELMDRVGELVIAQSRLKQIAADSADLAVKSVAEEVERLALELRDTTMSVRMMPIGHLFGRFRRLVHDLARDLGKHIEMVTEGEETELDKTVIERLADPMMHLLRNSIDHGLEDPAGRAAAGKPAHGTITLSARHVGAEVRVSIADDGRGLDKARIRARAEANGLVQPGAKLADAELYHLIFQPGFSTAEAVTNLSGRGVGMDVVKRTVDSLRGSIDIASAPGRGAEMVLRLPLTLAIIDGLLVRVGRGRYVIPLSAVEECVELSMEEDARSRGRSFLNIRGDLVPFLRLRELFNAREAPDRYQKVVIVSAGDLRVGLVVDQVIGDHQTVIKSLSKLHADVGIFSGATILGDGTVALILDIGNLVDHGQAQEARLKAAS
jgi:two-component system chemotaxis sensor kinase CheA